MFNIGVVPYGKDELDKFLKSRAAVISQETSKLAVPATLLVGFESGKLIITAMAKTEKE